MKYRLTVRGMMVLVAIAGVSSATARVHPALGFFVFSVLGLAAIRTFGSIGCLQSMSVSVRSFKAGRIFLSSTIVAATVFAAPLLSGLCLILLMPRPLHYVPDYRSLIGEIVVAALMAMPIVVLLRRRLW